MKEKRRELHLVSGILVLLIIVFSILTLNPRDIASSQIYKPKSVIFNMVYKKDEKVNLVPFIQKFCKNCSFYQSKRFARIIAKEAKKYRLDPLFVTSLISIESSFKIYATSNVGAMGLMQIMPETGDMIANKLGISLDHIEDLYKPEINICLGTWYINKLLKLFKDPIVAITAYNFGPGNALKLKRKYSSFPVYSYVIKIAKQYTELKTAMQMHKRRASLDHL